MCGFEMRNEGSGRQGAPVTISKFTNILGSTVSTRPATASTVPLPLLISCGSRLKTVEETMMAQEETIVDN